MLKTKTIELTEEQRSCTYYAMHELKFSLTENPQCSIFRMGSEVYHATMETIDEILLKLETP